MSEKTQKEIDNLIRDRERFKRQKQLRARYEGKLTRRNRDGFKL